VAVLFLALFSDHTRFELGFLNRLRRGMRQGVRTAIVATCVVTPLIAYHFGVVSLISIPANLLVVVAVTPVVVLAMLALPIALISPALGGALMSLTGPFISYIDWVLESFGREWAAISIPPFNAYWLVPFYVFLLMLWRPYVRQP
jgi:predicted membrane metal-binding protein